MYDAIVVGARCAGAPTAMLLARAGHRVLLVDRAMFPSDIMSTHYIHQPGVARLVRWGLLDTVLATNCPPIERVRLDASLIDQSQPPLNVPVHRPDPGGHPNRQSRCPANRRHRVGHLFQRRDVVHDVHARGRHAVDRVEQRKVKLGRVRGRDL